MATISGAVVGLCAVFNQHQLTFVRNIHNLIERHAAAEEVRDEYCFRLRSDCRAYRGAADRERFHFDIDGHRDELVFCQDTA